MKYKKYLLLLFLIIFMGINRVDAYTCYYASESLAGRLDIAPEGGKLTATVNRTGFLAKDQSPKEVDNKWGHIDMSYTISGEWGYSYTNTKFVDIPIVDTNTLDYSCPTYLIMYETYGVGIITPYIIMDESTLLKVKQEYTAYGIGKLYYAHSMYAFDPEKEFKDIGRDLSREEEEKAKKELNRLRREQSDEYWKKVTRFYTYNGEMLSGDNICDINEDGCELVNVCDDLLGASNNPNSIRHFLDQILKYVRIIVPILIILLGSFDFAKAMLSGKEDEMKKAQATFVKRVIAGIAVFFVPVFVDIVMWVANLVWNYATCPYK